MGQLIDLTGERFGRLVVLRREPRDHPKAHWRALCDCGNETVVRSDELRSGGIKSCGCFRSDRIREIAPKRVRGDSITYNSAHRRIHGDRGSAKLYSCSECGADAHEWSYRGGCPDERWETIKGRAVAYSLNPFMYDPLCRPCHRARDRRSPRDGAPPVT